jgi:hypothetical protein
MRVEEPITACTAEGERILEKERGPWGQLAVEPQARPEEG